MSSIGACATAGPPVPDFCAWAKPIIPDPGFETRWTRGEKEAVLTLDLNVRTKCPVWGQKKWGE